MNVTRTQIISSGANVSIAWFYKFSFVKERIVDNVLSNIYDSETLRNEINSYLKRIDHLKKYNKENTTAKCLSVLSALDKLEKKENK